MAFINWGEEGQEQKNLRAFFEQQAMYERAMNLKLQAQGGVGASRGVISNTPSGGSGSITFNGTNAYVRVPNNTMITWLPDTADFTLEWFMKRTGNGTGFPRVFAVGQDQAATIGCSIEGTTAYIWADGVWMSGEMPASYNNGSSWCYMAVSRVNGTARLYIGGEFKQSSTSTAHISDSVNPGEAMNIGGDGGLNWWAGKITNFRWVNEGLYTSETTIDIPTSPLTVIPNTALLLLGGSSANPVVDASGVNTLIDSNSGWDADTPFVV